MFTQTPLSGPAFTIGNGETVIKIESFPEQLVAGSTPVNT